MQSQQLPTTAAILNLKRKKGWGRALIGCRQQGRCRQAPKDGFTALLERPSPTPKPAKSFKLRIAATTDKTLLPFMSAIWFRMDPITQNSPFSSSPQTPALWAVSLSMWRSSPQHRPDQTVHWNWLNRWQQLSACIFSPAFKALPYTHLYSVPIIFLEGLPATSERDANSVYGYCELAVLGTRYPVRGACRHY